MNDIRKQCGMDLIMASACIERVARTIRASAPDDSDVRALWKMSALLLEMAEDLLPNISQASIVPTHTPADEDVDHEF